MIEHGLHHVAVETRRVDAEACRDFMELLGFARVDVPAGMEDIAVWVQHDGLQIHFLFVDDPDVPPRGHFAVVCPDYDAALARLRAAGHRVDDHEPYWGSPRAYAHTPAGHVVEVMAFPPGGDVHE